jgi:hypothetical protein
LELQRAITDGEILNINPLHWRDMARPGAIGDFEI